MDKLKHFNLTIEDDGSYFFAEETKIYDGDELSYIVEKEKINDEISYTYKNKEGVVLFIVIEDLTNAETTYAYDKGNDEDTVIKLNRDPLDEGAIEVVEVLSCDEEYITSDLHSVPMFEFLKDGSFENHFKTFDKLKEITSSSKFLIETTEEKAFVEEEEAIVEEPLEQITDGNVTYYDFGR